MVIMTTAKKKTGTTIVLIATALLAVGCGAGQYGFAKKYVPLGDEEDFWEQSKSFTYDAVNTDPDDYEGKLIGWFGVVQKVTKKDDGKYEVRMAHRKHQPRHLCSSDSIRSCRVTVHFRSSGSFSALLDLLPKDTAAGLDKVQPGSLMRVYGKVRCRENDDEQIVCDYDDMGGVLLDGSYYRQWPVRFFVTTRSASELKR